MTTCNIIGESKLILYDIIDFFVPSCVCQNLLQKEKIVNDYLQSISKVMEDFFEEHLHV